MSEGTSGILTDWLLTKADRGNGHTRLDDQHAGDQAWSDGNLVRPLVHGATYYARSPWCRTCCSTTPTVGRDRCDAGTSSDPVGSDLGIEVWLRRGGVRLPRRRL
jgi:hypothetical protein